MKVFSYLEWAFDKKMMNINKNAWNLSFVNFLDIIFVAGDR